MEMFAQWPSFQPHVRRQTCLPQASAAATLIQSIARGNIQRKKIMNCPVCLSMVDATLASSVARDCSHKLCQSCKLRCTASQGCCPICRRSAFGHARSMRSVIDPHEEVSLSTMLSTPPGHESTREDSTRTWRTSNLSVDEFIDFDADPEYEWASRILFAEHFNGISSLGWAGYHMPAAAFLGRPRGDRGVPMSAAHATLGRAWGFPRPAASVSLSSHPSRSDDAAPGGLRKAISLVLSSSFSSSRRGSRRGSEAHPRPRMPEGRGAERPRSQSI